MVKRAALYIGDATLKAAIGSLTLVIVMETVNAGFIAAQMLRERRRT